MIGLGLRLWLGSTVLSGGMALLSSEPQGLAIDFTTTDGLGSVAIRDLSNPANNRSNVPVDSIIVNSGTSPKLVYGSDGVLRWTPHNLFLNSASPATQSVTTITGATYTVHVVGSGSLAGSSGASGTASAGSDLTYVATGTTSTFTLTGSLTTMQMNRGSVATTYMATAGAAKYAVPIEFDPVTKVPYAPVEPQATNLLVQASDVSTTWLPTALTITADQAIAPDGTLTADKIAETSANTTHQILQTPTASTATTYAFSAYLKANGVRYVSLTWAGSSDGCYAVFDLQAGVVTQSSALAAGGLVGATITAAANGWWRVTLAGQVAASATKFAIFCPSNTGTYSADTLGRNSYAGSAANSFYVWGAQLELGSVATSPIPTFAATVTRAGDNLNIATSTFPALATAGTLIAKLRTALTANQGHWSVDDNTDQERFQSYSNGSSNASVFIGHGGVTQFSAAAGSLAAISANIDFKTAAAWAANDGAYVKDGGAPATDASITLPTVSIFHIGNNLGTANSGPTKLSTILAVPRRMTNSEIQLKTAA